MISLKSIASFLYVNDKKVLTEGYDSNWDGTVLADEQALRDFYGDNSIAVAGVNFTAKSYPDGSVVGSTDNGTFVMRANGMLTALMNENSSGTNSPTDYFYPIVFIDFPVANGSIKVSATTTDIESLTYRTIDTDKISFITSRNIGGTEANEYTVRAVYTSIQGRWKS